MYILCAFLVCTFIFSLCTDDTIYCSTEHIEYCFHTVPPEIKHKIITLVLAENHFKGAFNILCVSKDFEYMLKDRSLFIDAMELRDKRLSRGDFALTMGIKWGKQYREVNESLLIEKNFSSYFATVRHNPYADVNFTSRKHRVKENTLKKWSDTVSAWWNSSTQTETKLHAALVNKNFSWIKQLLAAHAHPDEYGDCSTHAPSSMAFMMILNAKTNTEKSEALSIMHLFLEYGANIHGVNDNDALFSAALYAESPEALALLVKYGLNLAGCASIIHEYLTSKHVVTQEKPSPAIIEFLSNHGYTPEELNNPADSFI